ncbi:hypothetical protein [Chloroflexus sp.]|uniref:hypothetical protein n=1 Tax=Chloroflexus sp. TaxID=1904827 RepID=UPI003D0BAA5A
MPWLRRERYTGVRGATRGTVGGSVVALLTQHRANLGMHDLANRVTLIPRARRTHQIEAFAAVGTHQMEGVVNNPAGCGCSSLCRSGNDLWSSVLGLLQTAEVNCTYES